MCIPKPVISFIRRKSVDYVQRWVNRESDMPWSIQKQMTMKDYYLHFWFASTLDM